LPVQIAVLRVRAIAKIRPAEFGSMIADVVMREDIQAVEGEGVLGEQLAGSS
jgi:hypothetical protein